MERRGSGERPARRGSVGDFHRRTARLRALPHFVILGGQRCGTSSLYEYIVHHPDVLPGVRKEVHFFDRHFERGVDFYRSHFPLRARLRLLRALRRSPVLTGEGSPYYLFYPPAAERMRATIPDVKLLVLVRDPVERAFSQYRMQVRKGRETLGFREAVEAEAGRLADGPEGVGLDRRGGEIRPHQHFSYVARGLYAEQLERWYTLFPRDHLVLRSEELFYRPRDVYPRVLRFLGLRPDVPFPEFEPHNLGDGVGLPEDARREMEERFREPNRRLAQLVGIDFDEPVGGTGPAGGPT